RHDPPSAVSVDRLARHRLTTAAFIYGNDVYMYSSGVPLRAVSCRCCSERAVRQVQLWFTKYLKTLPLRCCRLPLFSRQFQSLTLALSCDHGSATSESVAKTTADLQDQKMQI